MKDEKGGGLSFFILHPSAFILHRLSSPSPMSLDAKQFEQMALEQTDLLYRLARRLTHDPSRAEDLVQETFLRAFKARNTFRLEQYGIKPWLVRIMHNLH